MLKQSFRGMKTLSAEDLLSPDAIVVSDGETPS